MKTAMRAHYLDLAGEHVLITGGANGIGAAVARGFAAKGVASRCWTAMARPARGSSRNAVRSARARSCTRSTWPMRARLPRCSRA